MTDMFFRLGFIKIFFVVFSNMLYTIEKFFSFSFPSFFFFVSPFLPVFIEHILCVLFVLVQDQG